MNNLITLVKMQLLERLNLGGVNLKESGLFRFILKILAGVLKFAVITALCFAFLFVAKFLNIFAVSSVPATVISMVFLAMLGVSVISCTVGLTKAMYYSNDNAILLTLPCTPLQVFSSKLVIFFIFELKRNFSFIVPLFLAYFIISSYRVHFYFWMLLCFVLISMLTVGIGALLSIPGMWCANFFRQNKTLQIASLVLCVGLVFTALIYLISLIPENIDLLENWPVTQKKIRDFLDGFAVKLSPLYKMTLLMLGEFTWGGMVLPFGATALRFVILLGLIVAVYATVMLIVLPMFYKMASKPFEHLKRPVKAKKNAVLPRWFTAFYNELRTAIKSTDRIFSNVITLIAVPILIFLMNKLFLAMDTKALGDQMVIAFNILIVLLVVLNVNCYASSIFSRDGRSSYLIKTQPTNPALLLSAKLLPNTLFVIVSLVATAIVSASTLSISNVDTFYLYGGIGFIYLAHMFFCAQTDIMNPQLEIYSTVGNSDSNPNETLSTISAFIISFLTAAAMLLLLIENAGDKTYLKLFLVGLALVCWRTWSFFAHIKLYYKEK